MKQNTLYVIAYDIPNDRRRTKVHKLLCGFGKWTQYSLFECFLTQKEWLALHHRMEALLDPSKDSVRFYQMCAACVAKVETVGAPKPKEDETFII